MDNPAHTPAHLRAGLSIHALPPMGRPRSKLLVKINKRKREEALRRRNQTDTLSACPSTTPRPQKSPSNAE